MDMVIVAFDAHCPAFGVNVYTVEPIVDVLITAGDQLPEIGTKSVEIKGNDPGVVF